MFTCLSPWLNSELFGGKGGTALICVYFQQVAHDLAHCAYQYMVVKMPSQQKKKKKTLVELFEQKKKKKNLFKKHFYVQIRTDRSNELWSLLATIRENLQTYFL